MSTSAAGHLSPAFPERAAWGTAAKLRAWQEDALDGLPRRDAARLPRRRDPRRRQDHLRPADRDRAARPRRRPRGHRRRPHRAPQDPVGRRRRRGSASSSTRAFSNSSGLPVARVRRRRRHLRAGRLQAAAAPPRAPRTRRRSSSSTRSTTAATRGRGATASARPSSRRTRRLSLTGTPFRSDTTPIPFVRYEMGAGRHPALARPTTRYGYAAALRDGVVRPVLFLAYGGAMRWRTKAGDEVAARLGEPLTKDQTAQAWRTALDPKGEWMPVGARRRRQAAQRGAPPRAGCRWAGHRLQPDLGAGLRQDPPRGITGEDPDRRALRRRRGERAASRRSPRATCAGWSRCAWCPRASTCRGCASGSTPRRPRPRCSSPRRSAVSCGRGAAARRPRSSCRRCRSSSSTPPRLEEERDHALDRPTSRRATRRRCGREEEGLLAAANRDRGRPRASTSRPSRRWSPTPHFDHVLFDAQQFGLHAAVGSRGRAGLPRPAGPARARPGGHPAARAAGEADAGRRGARRAPPASGPSPVSAHRALAAAAQGAQHARRGLLVEDRRCRTRASTWTCAGRAAGPSSPPPRASR